VPVMRNRKLGPGIMDRPGLRAAMHRRSVKGHARAPLAKALMLMAGMALLPFRASAADVWQECQIETSVLCDPQGCRSVEPTLKLYLGQYKDSAGKLRGYYYRCRRAGSCDMIENPWIGENERYLAFVARERGVISRIGPGGKLTDVATLDDNVLISRGTCWNAAPHKPDLSAER
jgi:plasmid stability protein